jgi:hypothetical protein
MQDTRRISWMTDSVKGKFCLKVNNMLTLCLWSSKLLELYNTTDENVV